MRAVRPHLFFAALGALVCSAPTAAQERRDTPQQIEQTVRRRVESWLRERAPGKLTCPTCKGEHRHPPCESCDGTRINPHRVDNAFWRYLRPSYRRGKDRESWIKERIFDNRDGGTARWGNHPAVIEGARVQRIQVSRDAVYVTVEPSEADSGWMQRRSQLDVWVREDRNFYIDLTNEPADELVQHDWFVLGTFSVNRFASEVERLSAGEERANLTDLERAQLRRDREKAEKELRERTVADLGLVANVRKIPAMRRDEAPTFEVAVSVGILTLALVMPASDENPADVIEDRLSGLAQGTRVFFRGRPLEWRRSHEYLGLAELSLTDCELQTSP